MRRPTNHCRLGALLLLLAGCGGISITEASPTTTSPPPPPAPTRDDAGTAAPATADGLLVLTHRVDGISTFGEQAGTDLFPLFRSAIAPDSGLVIPRDGCRITVMADRERASTFEGHASAGTVHARAGRRSIAIPYTEKFDGYMPATFPGPGALSPGEPLDIDATGGDVPAFRTTVNLVAPVQVSNDPSRGIARNEPFVVRWEPSSDERDLYIRLSGASRDIECITDSRANRFEIAADYVNAVADDADGADAGAPSLSLYVESGRSTRIRAGAYQIDILDNRPSFYAKLALR